jgi:hypothetical protein
MTNWRLEQSSDRHDMGFLLLYRSWTPWRRTTQTGSMCGML